MVFLLVGQVKGGVLQPLIGGFLYRVMRGRSFMSLKNIGIVTLCGLVVFVSIYLGAMWIADGDVITKADTYIFLGRHFSYYLTAGVLGFSEAFASEASDVGGSSKEIFSPFFNVYRTLTGSGKLVVPGSSHGRGMQTDLNEDSVDSSSNVYTLFGTLYFYLGILGSLIYVTGMASLCYALFLAAGWTRNEWLLVLYCYVGTQLVFGFFEFYFWHLDTYEIAVYTLVFAGFSFFAQKRPSARSAVSIRTTLFAKP
jgi:hypothetical protein